MRITGILLLILCVTMSCKAIDKNNHEITKVDSLFFFHFQVLDSLANNNFIDSTLRCIESMKFMELNTGVSSYSDGNYFGKTSFTKDDLEAWHKWYALNKDKIIWDEETNKVKFK